LIPGGPDRAPWRSLDFFCAGEGCGARLACGEIHEGREIEVCLEPRYTNGPHPRYPAGTWWRKKLGGYKGMPNARDARKAMRDIDGATEGVPPEAVGQVVKETLKRGDLLDNVYAAQAGRLTGAAGVRAFRDSTEYRDHTVLLSRGKLRRAASILRWGRRHVQPRPALPPGTHIVVCYRCGGKASIETPVSGSLLGGGSI
jgi:hypothetical protein